MEKFPDDTGLAETDMAMLLWVVFREQSIVMFDLPLANNLQSADESLRISVYRIGFSRASPGTLWKRAGFKCISTTNFEAALGQQLPR